MNEAAIILKNITKTYKKKHDIKVLNGININLEVGKLYAIMGSSGSGKSTLINILGLVENFDSGEYILKGENVKNFNDTDLSRLRCDNIGFVFQDYLLDPNLTALENVMMPLYINNKITKKEKLNVAHNILVNLNLEHRLNHFPFELSGGEQQRVAIARALVNNPDIILADEPTGNLDYNTQIEIFELLKKLSRGDKCVIVVSHSEKIMDYADITYQMINGVLELK